MLGKLFKYEWKGFRFPLMIMLIVLAGTTALACGVILSINPRYDDAFRGFSVSSLILSLLMYYFGIIGCSLGVMLVIAIRFYKTCYSDNGYLTHTLPVSTQKILNVKIISSFITVMLMTLATVATVFIILNVGLNHIISIAIAEEGYTNIHDIEEARRAIYEEISSVFTGFKDVFGISLGMYIAYMIVYYIIAVFSNVVTVLGCVSLGQLYAKHRIIGAIIAYFVVQFILQIFMRIAIIPMYGRMMSNIGGHEKYTIFGFLSPTMNLTLLFMVIMAAAMYFINLHMMTKKLNLE
ncbi:MAG: hypothetical protein K2K21_05350 [Lachnospiraceae bacterium]|nr:hypothetical protein [Lachnospiraceae bacterium]